MTEAKRDAPLPAAASVLVLLALLVAVGAVLVGLPPREGAAGEPHAAFREAAGARDPLTGRLPGPDGTPEAPGTGFGSAERPLRLRFVPSADVAQAGPAIEGLLRFLRERAGLRVEGATLRSYGLVVQEIVQGKCDVAFLTAASYARARFATENDGDASNEIDAFLQVVRTGHPDFPGSELAYRAALIVRDDSPIRSLDDLSSATRVALGSRTSGASSILPTALFRRRGLRPETQRFEGGYQQIVLAVLQGAVDVGAVWWSPPTADRPLNDARQLVLETHPDVFERTRIVAHTDWIPNEPVVARAEVPEEVRRVLARALQLYLVQKSLTAEGRLELTALGSPVGLIEATDEDFGPLLEVIESAFADDPEGWRDFTEGSG
jgi:phosphate/phosphite/phosphonate ABC transporter binding protein